jgi:hypothetical protein
MSEVMLPQHLVRYAALVGVERMLAGMTKPGRYGAIQEDGWRLNIIGACGEAAVAKYLGVYWDGAIGDFSAKDVGAIQTRANGRENGDLILHHSDNNEDVFILIIAARLPTVNLAGWILGGEGKRLRFWREASPSRPGRPAFFVPQAALNPMEALL